jgi:hypothetical protein
VARHAAARFNFFARHRSRSGRLAEMIQTIPDPVADAALIQAAADDVHRCDTA